MVLSSKTHPSTTKVPRFPASSAREWLHGHWPIRVGFWVTVLHPVWVFRVRFLKNIFNQKVLADCPPPKKKIKYIIKKRGEQAPSFKNPLCLFATKGAFRNGKNDATSRVKLSGKGMEMGLDVHFTIRQATMIQPAQHGWLGNL